jgi:hypothetical protein
MRGASGLMLDGEGRIWVPDHASRRASIFDPDAGFMRSHPFRVLRWAYVRDGVMGADGRVRELSVTLTATGAGDVLRVYDETLTPVDSVPFPERPEVDPNDPPGSFY